MASSDAQKSEVHDTTDDASSSPGSNARSSTRKLRPASPTSGAINPGNVEEDRAKIVPEPPPPKGPKGSRDDSDFGGPLKLDDPSMNQEED
jgi:hypothetical protein